MGISAEARRLPFWWLVPAGDASSLLLTFGVLHGTPHAPKSPLRLHVVSQSEALATSRGVQGEAPGQC